MTKLFEVIASVIKILGNAFILMMTVVIGLQVILRYAFNSAATWPEELCRYSMLWLVFCGIILIEKDSNHLRVEVLYELASPFIKRILDIIGRTVTIIFYVIACYLSWKMMLLVKMTGQVGVGLPVPIWMIWIIIPAGFALSLIYCIRNIILNRKNLSR